MKVYEILSEGRPGRQKTAVMYHGTTDKYLQSIKVYGLRPDRPGNGFGSDEPGMESYGGVYLTADRGTAEEAASEVSQIHGGNPIIITVQYVLGSGGADEDQILHSLLDIIDDIGSSKTFVKRAPAVLGGNLPQGDYRYLVSFYNRVKRIANGEDAFSYEEEILTDPKIRQIVRYLLSKTRMSDIKRDTNVRLTRPITFKGKTRITNIEKIASVF